MKIYWDTNKKECNIYLTPFDRIINFLIVLLVISTILIIVFKPNLNELLFSKSDSKEEIKFSEGSELNWDEYNSIIGNKKYLKEYIKIKSAANGYINYISNESDNVGIYTIILTRSKEDKSSDIVIYTGDIENIKIGNAYISGKFSYKNGKLYTKHPSIVQTKNE